MMDPNRVDRSWTSRLLALLASGDARSVMAKGSAGSLLVQASGLALGVATQLVLVRLTGVEAFGHYAYVLAWVSTIGLLATLGTDTTILRFVAAYQARRQWNLLLGVMRWSVLTSLAVSLIAAAIAGLALVLLRESISPPLLRTFAWGVAVIPALALLQVVGASLRALLKAGRARLPELVIRPLVLLLVSVAAWSVLGKVLTGATVIAIHALSVIVALGVAATWVSHRLPADRTFGRASRANAREWLAVSLPLLFVASMQLIMAQTDTILVGLLVDTRLAGIYAVTTRLAGFTSFVLTAAVAIAAPLIAALHSEERTGELQGLLSLTARGTALATIPIVAILALFGKEILTFFDPAFAVAYPALMILTVGQCLNVLAGMAGTVLSMTGHQRVVALVMTGAAFANVALNLALIPHWQIEGAAAATALSVVLWNVLLSLYAWHKLGLSTTMIPMTRPGSTR